MRFSFVMRGLGPAVVLVAVVSCQTLPELPVGLCGNGVRDTGEDCDDIEGDEFALIDRCGKPDSAGACRYLCTPPKSTSTTTSADASAAQVECRTGYHCGSDGLCRLPDNTFTVGASIAVGADRMMAADLAGSGISSILAVSRDILDLGYPRLLAFDANGQQVGNEVLEGSFGLGGVADVNSDKHDDVLFSRLDGLLLTLGAGATSVTAVSSDAIALPEGAHVRLVTVPGTASLAGSTGRTSELLTFVSNLNVPDFDPSYTVVVGNDLQDGVLAAFERPVETFTERTASLPDPLFKCDRVVVVQKGGTSIESLQPCCPIVVDDTTIAACRGGSRLPRAPSESVILTALGIRDELAKTTGDIVAGPWALDVDGDSRTDIVVATQNGDDVRLEVAYAGTAAPNAVEGDPSRALYGLPPNLGTPAARPRRTTRLLQRDAAGKNVPLLQLLDLGVETREVEILDPATNRTVREPRRFFTLADASFLAHAEYQAPPGPHRLGAPSLVHGNTFRRTTRWTSGQLASFRSDGLLDAVGGRERAIDLDVALGTQDLAFNVSSVRTGLSTDQLAIADVDGDRTSDVLLASNSGRGSLLSVLLGRQEGVPSELVPLGSFEHVEQMVAAPLAFGLLGEDSAADIGLVTRSEPGGGDAVTILRSVGGRLPFSLYGLEGEIRTEQRRIVAAPLSSTLIRREGGSDLVAVGAESRPNPADPTKQISTYRLWWGGVTVEGQRTRIAASSYGDPLALHGILGEVEGATDAGFNALLRAADLDGNGVDEAVVGVSTDTTETSPVVFVATRTATGYATTLPPTIVPAGNAPRGGQYLRALAHEMVDVDADGRLDLVVLLASRLVIDDGDETDIFDPSARDTVVVVIPNENGLLAPARATVLATPAKVRALAVGTVGEHTDRSLVLLTESGPGPGQQTVYSWRDNQFSVLYTSIQEDARTLAGARSLVVTDVTGDGIDDLVVGTRDRVTVLRAGAQIR